MFQSNNLNPENNITIIGIGKLGLCTALCFEARGYNVLGVDVSENYVNNLNDKTFTSSEPFVNAYLKQSTNFQATTDLERGLRHSSNLIFIVVPTPTQKGSNTYDHNILINLLSSINEHKVKNKHIVICCTVMPGFITKIAKFLIKDCENTFLAYNPEFIAQGSIIHDFVNASMVLIGAEKKETSDVLRKIYEKVADNARICVMSIESAEIAKIALNCFITTKIAFANMIGDIADNTENANKNDILFAIGSDPRIGNKCLKAGFGFGGPCFPRDNRALAHYAHSVKVFPFIPLATDESNKFHTEIQFEEYDRKKDPIVLENVGYKNPCPVPIIEESQKLIIADKLASNNHKVIIVDHDHILNEVKKVYNDKFTYVSKDKLLHKIYISHYSKLKDRREFMDQQLKNHKIIDLAPIDWIDFYDREDITEDQIRKNFKYNPQICPRHLTMAEIANFMGHAHAIEEIANNESVLTGMIIEDDMIFKQNYVKHLEYAFKIVPSNWDIIVVGGAFHGGKDCTLKDQYDDPKKFHIYRPSSPFVCTGNYIMHKESAKKIVSSPFFKPFSAPIDDTLCKIASSLHFNVYWCRPWFSLEGSKTGKYESVAGRGF